MTDRTRIRDGYVEHTDPDFRVMHGGSLGPSPDDDVTIDLTDEQRERAIDALEAVGVERGDDATATHALDLIDRWDRGPRYKDMTQWQEAAGMEAGESSESVAWIDLSDVVGVERGNIGWFEQGRVRSALQLLLTGQFARDFAEYDHRAPRYTNVNGDLYVGGDGTHRTIALKAAGIDRIRGRVLKYDVPEDQYREWKARRDRGLLHSVPGDENPDQYLPDPADREPWPEHTTGRPDPGGVNDQDDGELLDPTADDDWPYDDPDDAEPPEWSLAKKRAGAATLLAGGIGFLVGGPIGAALLGGGTLAALVALGRVLRSRYGT